MSEVLIHQGDYKLTSMMEGDVSVDLDYDGEYGKYIPVEIAQAYTGTRTVTPTESVQILDTTGLLMPGNVTVQAIPTNYGRITFNGSVITVS
jgi:hypothetical protein